MWKYDALLSAFFAALTAVFAKIGVRSIDSNLATAIRTTVVLLLTWGIVLLGGAAGGRRGVDRRSWLFLILWGGAATGLSWPFYFKALQTGDAVRVAPIDKLSVVFTLALAALFLHESVTPRILLGAALIAAGSIVLLVK